MSIKVSIFKRLLIVSISCLSCVGTYASTSSSRLNTKLQANTTIYSKNEQLLREIRQHYQPLYHGNHLKDYRAEINAYAKDRVGMEKLVLNSKTYLYFIYQETRKYHVPAQIVFVPAAETNYAGGRSSVGAVGLWQFMLLTAKESGLHVKPGYDGRQDVVNATDAAIKHLKASHDHFNSWLLAFAAYNCGDGCVDQAIKHNKARGLPTDFWHLSLPHQTEKYVRNILAISAIMTHPSHYRIKLPPMPNKPVFADIKIKHHVMPSSAGYISGVSFSKMKKLNPAIKNWQVSLSHDYNLLVPNVDKTQAIARLASVNAIAVEA